MDSIRLATWAKNSGHPIPHWMAPMGFGIGGVVYMNGTPKMRNKNRVTPKWMVYEGKPKIKWMIWGSPILRNLQILNQLNQWTSKRGGCSGGVTVPPGLRIWVGVWILAPSHFWCSKVIQSHPKSSDQQIALGKIYRIDQLTMVK
jgi:hypothetical protein